MGTEPKPCIMSEPFWVFDYFGLLWEGDMGLTVIWVFLYMFYVLFSLLSIFFLSPFTTSHKLHEN